jgi:site-specific recombinase XerD
MTHLRKMMLEELERRNYAQTTISSYIRTIEDFARYFRRPPDQLTPEHIREYQAYLFRERELAASTVTQRLAALRFFYTRTIKKAWSVADTPYPKKTRHLPSILSPQEVAHLIDSSQTRFHRVVLMTLYGTGVRRAELARLQIPDIDSRRVHRRTQRISEKTNRNRASLPPQQRCLRTQGHAARDSYADESA